MGTWFVRILTVIHALGSIVLVGMTTYLLAGGPAGALARTPGGRLMVEVLGPWLAVFLGSLAAFLAALAWSSLQRRPWAWRAATAAYSVGILGSLWEVSVGVTQAWLSVGINSVVVLLLLAPMTRRVYFQHPPSS